MGGGVGNLIVASRIRISFGGLSIPHRRAEPPSALSVAPDLRVADQFTRRFLSSSVPAESAISCCGCRARLRFQP
jgi:hypothetical protein